jgi:lysophospholipase L1-like esterase
MRKNVFAIFLSCFFLLPAIVTVAQEQKPFWNEIQQFKKADSLQSPPKNAILFVGSSSFRMWKDVAQAFPGRTIINRGFGGSSLPHVIMYAKDIIFPYQPKQVVIYCGENDLTADSVTAETVYVRLVALYSLLKVKLGDVPVVFVSIKPSPSRWHLQEKMMEANRRIKAFLAKQKNTAYVDVWNLMLNPEGKPNEELFIADMLHMNEKGYAIWTKKIEPYLLEK